MKIQTEMGPMRKMLASNVRPKIVQESRLVGAVRPSPPPDIPSYRVPVAGWPQSADFGADLGINLGTIE
jgi:hypothetical protein